MPPPGVDAALLRSDKEGAMPQELLRDVLRTGDQAERTRRRLSILPLSIAAHAVAGTLFVIMPLAAEVDVPPIAAAFRAEYMPTAAPPPAPPPPRTAAAPEPAPGAPISAPDRITPEVTLARPDGPVIEGAIGAIGSAVTGPGVLTPNIPPVPEPPPPQPKIARPGFQGIREPKRIAYVAPEYPEIARLSRVQGTVILEAVLDVTGRVHSVRVLKSVALLDEAAIRAVRQWRYTPTELNGVPVQVLMTVTVNFQLSK
jgi:protein TonB